MYFCMRINVFACVCMKFYKHIHVSLCACEFLRVFMCITMHLLAFVYVFACVYMRLRVFWHALIYVYTCVLLGITFKNYTYLYYFIWNIKLNKTSIKKHPFPLNRPIIIRKYRKSISPRLIRKPSGRVTVFGSKIGQF